jgi:hypothetical protein
MMLAAKTGRDTGFTRFLLFIENPSLDYGFSIFESATASFASGSVLSFVYVVLELEFHACASGGVSALPSFMIKKSGTRICALHRLYI